MLENISTLSKGCFAFQNCGMVFSTLSISYAFKQTTKDRGKASVDLNTNYVKFDNKLC